MTELATKTAFAQMMGVGKSAVSNWITEGILTSDAFQGEGRRAKVIVEVARAQVERNRDPGQSVGNGLKTGGVPTRKPVEPQPDDGVETQIKQQALLERQFRNRKFAEDEALRQQQLLSKDHVEREMRRVIGQMLNQIEGQFPDLANDIAKACDVPQKDVQHALKKGFHKVRAKVAKENADKAASLPELVETQITGVSEC